MTVLREAGDVDHRHVLHPLSSNRMYLTYPSFKTTTVLIASTHDHTRAVSCRR